MTIFYTFPTKTLTDIFPSSSHFLTEFKNSVQVWYVEKYLSGDAYELILKTAFTKTQTVYRNSNILGNERIWSGQFLNRFADNYTVFFDWFTGSINKKIFDKQIHEYGTKKFSGTQPTNLKKTDTFKSIDTYEKFTFSQYKETELLSLLNLNSQRWEEWTALFSNLFQTNTEV